MNEQPPSEAALAGVTALRTLIWYSIERVRPKPHVAYLLVFGPAAGTHFALFFVLHIDP
jgi:hypothetical protein